MMDLYEDYIKGNREWEFYGIFADQGISGTSTTNRNVPEGRTNIRRDMLLAAK